jgi:hypothetical protein
MNRWMVVGETGDSVRLGGKRSAEETDTETDTETHTMSDPETLHQTHRRKRGRETHMRLLHSQAQTDRHPSHTYKHTHTHRQTDRQTYTHTHTHTHTHIVTTKDRSTNQKSTMNQHLELIGEVRGELKCRGELDGCLQYAFSRVFTLLCAVLPLQYRCEHHMKNRRGLTMHTRTNDCKDRVRKTHTHTHSLCGLSSCVKM